MIGSETKAIVVGISGASSSGKTTLSRLLRDIFPNTFILHEDDFFLQEAKPFYATFDSPSLILLSLTVKHGMKDGDCAEALMIPEMAATLDYIRKHGTFPPGFESTEDKNDGDKSLVPDSTIAELKAKVKQWTEQGNIGHELLDPHRRALKLCIFEGFLLYSDSLSAVHNLIDIKYFLQVSHAKSKARREERFYVVREGVWQDPPGYFDKIVWPNYVEDHQWMFENGDVDGRMRKETLREAGIEAQIDKDPDVDMETTLKWAVESLIRDLTMAAE